MAYAQKLYKVFKPVTCSEIKSSLRPECLESSGYVSHTLQEPS